MKIYRKLPDKPTKGKVYCVRTKSGLRYARSTGKKGFGKWRFVKKPR